MVRKLNQHKILIACLIIICAVLIGVSIYLSSLKPIDFKEFDVSFKVDKTVSAGFDVSTDALRFGSINPGGGGKREVIITNNYDFPLEIKVLLSENLQGLVSSDTGVVAMPDENVSIAVKLAIPGDMEDGNYMGKIRFEMYK